MNNIISAKYSRTRHSVTRALYQYNYGQKLTFDGFNLDTTYEVHFANVGDEESVVMFGDENGVQIPDECLRTGEDIDAWVYLHDGNNDGESVYRITIPVIKRAKIADTPDSQPVEYIFDGTNSSTEDPQEYIFEGGDSSNT